MMASHETAIEKIPVKRTAILERLQKNREKHTAEYADAYKGYLEKSVALLEEAASAARSALDAGHKVSFDIGRLQLSQPSDHTRDYDLAIDVMENWQGDVVELSPQDYARYMRDEWSWAAAHRRTYLANSGPVGPQGEVGLQGPTGPRGFIVPA